mmetsp:Transcript_21480/g.61352  ORF Transcript_21480/g.61352 Transcript_21480/m.61352 type:complete len:274 (-) Transcript_21480:2-823(-)
MFPTVVLVALHGHDLLVVVDDPLDAMGHVGALHVAAAVKGDRIITQRCEPLRRHGRVAVPRGVEHVADVHHGLDHEAAAAHRLGVGVLRARGEVDRAATDGMPSAAAEAVCEDGRPGLRARLVVQGLEDSLVGAGIGDRGVVDVLLATRCSLLRLLVQGPIQARRFLLLQLGQGGGGLGGRRGLCRLKVHSAAAAAPRAHLEQPQLASGTVRAGGASVVALDQLLQMVGDDIIAGGGGHNRDRGQNPTQARHGAIGARWVCAVHKRGLGRLSP